MLMKLEIENYVDLNLTNDNIKYNMEGFRSLEEVIGDVAMVMRTFKLFSKDQRFPESRPEVNTEFGKKQLYKKVQFDNRESVLL